MEGNSPRARDTRPEIVFEDGLGPRYRWTAAATTPEHVGIEMHLLRASLAGAPAFEFALRERVARLSRFHHPSFSAVHGVERGQGKPPELLLFSDAAAGMRLSLLLEDAYTSGIPLDCDAALCILRQLVDAIAALHTFGLDVSHGAISAERLHIVAPARLLVADHALASALQQLRYPAEQYWSELGVAVPSQPQPPVFDQRLDVIQIGALGVALLRGYPLELSEWQGDLAEALSATRASSADGTSIPLPPGVRGWLSRALQVNPLYAFSSAVDAKAALDALLDERGGGDDGHLTAFLSKCFGGLEPFWTADDEYPRTFTPPEAASPLDAERWPPESDADVWEGRADAPPADAASTAPVADVRGTGPVVDRSDASAPTTEDPVPVGAASPTVEPPPSLMSAPDVAGVAIRRQDPVDSTSPTFAASGGDSGAAAARETTDDAHAGEGNESSNGPRGTELLVWPRLDAASLEAPAIASVTRGRAPGEGRASGADEESFDVVTAMTGETWPRIARDGRDSSRVSDEALPEPDLLGIDARLARSPIEVTVRATVDVEGSVGAEPAPVRRRVRWLGGFLGLFCVGATSGVVFGWNEPPPARPPALGMLALSSTPAGTDTYVNSAYRGVTPLSIVLPPGVHVVELRGETSRRLRIVVSPGLRLSQFVDLPNSGQPVTKERTDADALQDLTSTGSTLSGDGFTDLDGAEPAPATTVHAN